MVTDAQKKAKANYRKKCKSITIEFYPSDMELLEFLEKQGQKSTYLKDLVRREMESIQ